MQLSVLNAHDFSLSLSLSLSISLELHPWVCSCLLRQALARVLHGLLFLEYNRSIMTRVCVALFVRTCCQHASTHAM